MTARAAYLVITTNRRTPEPSVIEAHLQYLERLRSDGSLVLAGPFTDRSGGAYVFRADSVETAHRVVAEDPLVARGTAEGVVHAWAIDEG